LKKKRKDDEKTEKKNTCPLPEMTATATWHGLAMLERISSSTATDEHGAPANTSRATIQTQMQLTLEEESCRTESNSTRTLI